MGSYGLRQDYFMGGTKLEGSQVQKDLVNQSLSGSSQCQQDEIG